VNSGELSGDKVEFTLRDNIKLLFAMDPWIIHDSSSYWILSHSKGDIQGKTHNCSNSTSWEEVAFHDSA